MRIKMPLAAVAAGALLISGFTTTAAPPDASAACRTVIEDTSMTPIVVGVSKVKTSTFTVDRF